MTRKGEYEHLREAVLDSWPEHAAFLARNEAHPVWEGPELDQVADAILNIAGQDIHSCVADYKWMQSRFMAAEMSYRRQGRYESASFESVQSGIYKPEEMSRYMNGLMLSQVTWPQHFAVLKFFLRNFIGRAPAGARYLEVGPGHGLGFAMAARALQPELAVGWDISPVSLAKSERALRLLAPSVASEMVLQDVCEPNTGTTDFDRVVVGQVLEIVSDPEAALNNVRESLRANGQVFLNCPVRAAAPDHIRRWTTGDEVDALLQRTGFTILERSVFAAGGRQSSAAPEAYVIIAAAG